MNIKLVLEEFKKNFENTPEKTRTERLLADGFVRNNAVNPNISHITSQQCAVCRERAILGQPSNSPICIGLSTIEVISLGSNKMREDGFIFSEGIGDV